MTETIPLKYSEFAFALRSLSHCHVQVTHPEDFVRHAGEVLGSIKRNNTTWIYTGLESVDQKGWSILPRFLEKVGPLDWIPLGPVGLTEALRTVVRAMRQETQNFFFVPNGDLLFQDPVVAANLTSFTQCLLQNKHYSVTLVSYGYGPCSPSVSHLMSNVDERPAQAVLGIQDGRQELAEFSQHISIPEEIQEKLAVQYSGMTRMQVKRITNEMVVRARKAEPRQVDVQHLIDFRQANGLPPI